MLSENCSQQVADKTITDMNYINNKLRLQWIRDKDGFNIKALNLNRWAYTATRELIQALVNYNKMLLGEI